MANAISLTRSTLPVLYAAPKPAPRFVPASLPKPNVTRTVAAPRGTINRDPRPNAIARAFKGFGDAASDAAGVGGTAALALTPLIIGGILVFMLYRFSKQH